MKNFFRPFGVVIAVGIGLLASACLETEPEQSLPEPVVLDEPDVFLSAESAGLMLTFNVDLLSTGELVVADPGLTQIVVFNPDGTEQLRFGSQGKGPGEITSLDNFDILNDEFFVGDRSQQFIQRYNRQGEFVSSTPYQTHRGSFGVFALTDTSSYVAASMGENGSLIKWFNATSDSSDFWGIAKGEAYTMTDMGIMNDYLKRGEIPPSDMNDVDLVSDGEYVYAYLTAHGIVQKYDFSGNLVWETDANVPLNKLIFENAISRAKEINMPGVMASYSLISSFKAIDGDVYTLSFPIEGQPRTLLRINKNGEITGHFHIKEEGFNYFDFTVDSESGTLYLGAPELGEVHRVQLK